MSLSVGKIDIRLLSGCSYSRNVSVARLFNHYQVARDFQEQCNSIPKPDAIFCCWPTIELGYVAVRFANANSIPVVLDVRDLWPDLLLQAAPIGFRSVSKIALAPYYFATRHAFRNATTVVGISDQYLKWGLAYADRSLGPGDRVFPLGYEVPNVSSSNLRDSYEKLRVRGVKNSGLICWFVGTFGDTYDLETVIQGARKLTERGVTDVQFVLSGDGEKRKKYEKLATDVDSVVFTGWLNTNEIACMMDVANVGLAAYRKGAPQGLPNKVFEYMAAGLPILSSLSGECEEFLKTLDCGITYCPGNADELVDAVLLLREDVRHCKKLGVNGREAFLGQYSASSIYSKLSDYLEEVIVK